MQGLGKTIEVLALVHAHRPQMGPTGEPVAGQKRSASELEADDVAKTPGSSQAKASSPSGGSRRTPRPSRATLVVCPMSLLGQWRREAEASSAPGSLSILTY